MDIQELKKIRIVDFCNQNGIALKQDSREYYRLVDHDSCVISDRKNLFKWNSRDVGGDIFNFVQAYYDCSFAEAKKKLQSNDFEYEEHKYVPKTKEPFQYHEEKEVPISKARDYLIKERRLSETLVDDFISRGLIKQDNHSNVLFIWKDKDKVVGCTEQGTKQFSVQKNDGIKMRYWKKIQKNSKEFGGFRVSFGEPKNMYFFESEIDLMSYITQKPEKANNATFVSMNGLKVGNVLHAVTDYFKEFNELPDTTYICVDNDKAGRTFISTEFEGKGIGKEGLGYSEVKADLPKKEGFDWNDNLIKGKEIIDDMNPKDLAKLVSFAQKTNSISRNYEMSF